MERRKASGEEDEQDQVEWLGWGWRKMRVCMRHKNLATTTGYRKNKTSEQIGYHDQVLNELEKIGWRDWSFKPLTGGVGDGSK